MRISIIEKKHSLKFLIVKISIFTLCITSFLGVAVSQVTVVSSEHQHSLLSHQIAQIHEDNKKLKSQNKILESTIKKDEVLYKSKLDNTKIAYLTFDDGVSSNTLQILKVLKKYNIKATFFVNGHPESRFLYKQISDDGHTLANHTYSHDYNSIYASPDNFKKDVKKLDSFLTEITGKKPSHILRYPGGSNNTISHSYGGMEIMNSVISEMNKDGYKYFDWNVDSSDASAFCQHKHKIIESVLTQSSRTKHAIILMHDLNPKTTTVEALPEIIEGLTNQGFIFDVLSENTYPPQFKVVK
ncbi:polysaccharide deacetylase [Clostridium sp. CF011]|uniref:polysaccharide deacetylase family protein n=1 Tax=Clostridium sp. CF011 TaxID=2843318 RepID=UPI001C0B7F07|nr:polysaccharide deacetylase family protein [Clostridium sp. CF011]MBU3091437.1 polysaccharide deacetylase [Clostridium sp. CF011]WAG69248.1 polysaccharide deacetylase [Clostridium sp. CF011]